MGVATKYAVREERRGNRGRERMMYGLTRTWREREREREIWRKRARERERERDRAPPAGAGEAGAVVAGAGEAEAGGGSSANPTFLGVRPIVLPPGEREVLRIGVSPCVNGERR